MAREWRLGELLRRYPLLWLAGLSWGVGLTLLLLTVISLMTGWTGPRWFSVLNPLPNAFFAIGLFIVGPTLRRHQARMLKANPPAASSVDHHAIRMTVKADGVVVGRDSGFVAFVDGWLVFDGARCAFSVPASSLDEAESVIPNEAGKGLAELAFRVPETLLTVRLDPQAREDVSQAVSFLRELREWVTLPGSSSSGAVLPPIDPQPNSQLGTRAQVVVHAFALAFLVLGIWLVMGPSFPKAFALPLGSFLAVMVGAFLFEGVKFRRARRALVRLRQASLSEARLPDFNADSESERQVLA